MCLCEWIFFMLTKILRKKIKKKEQIVYMHTSLIKLCVVKINVLKSNLYAFYHSPRIYLSSVFFSSLQKSVVVQRISIFEFPFRKLELELKWDRILYIFTGPFKNQSTMQNLYEYTLDLIANISILGHCKFILSPVFEFVENVSLLANMVELHLNRQWSSLHTFRI